MLRKIQALGLLLIVSILLKQSVFAHGGEDHSEEKQAPIASIGQMNLKLARTDIHEVLIKYPTPKFGEETLLRVIITELKTNSPVAGMNISLILDHDGKSRIEAAAAPTNSPGIYEAHVAFPDAGQYNARMQLSGSNINEQVTIAGIVVTQRAVDGAKQNSSKIPPMTLIALLVLLASVAAGGYLFWLRPRRFQQSDMEA